MWRCQFRADEGRDLVKDRVRSDVFDFVDLPTTMKDMDLDDESFGLDHYRPSNHTPRTTTRRTARSPIRYDRSPGSPVPSASSVGPSSASTSMGSAREPLSQYARSLMSMCPSEESLKPPKHYSIFDDEEMMGDEIVQKMKQLTPRGKRTAVTVSDEDDEDLDRISPFSRLHYSNAPSLVLTQSRAKKSVPSADQYARMFERYGNIAAKSSLL